MNMRVTTHKTSCAPEINEKTYIHLTYNTIDGHCESAYIPWGENPNDYIQLSILNRGSINPRPKCVITHLKHVSGYGGEISPEEYHAIYSFLNQFPQSNPPAKIVEKCCENKTDDKPKNPLANLIEEYKQNKITKEDMFKKFTAFLKSLPAPVMSSKSAREIKRAISNKEDEIMKELEVINELVIEAINKNLPFCAIPTRPDNPIRNAVIKILEEQKGYKIDHGMAGTTFIGWN